MIIVITGLMASGKSTVAQLVAESLPEAVHLRGDAFRTMIASGRGEMGAGPSREAVRQLELRYRLTATAAKGYHRAGFDVVVQDNDYGEMLPHFLSLLAPEKAKTVVLCPSAEALAKREAARSKKGHAGFWANALYRKFMGSCPTLACGWTTAPKRPSRRRG